MSEFQEFYTANRQRLFSYLFRRCGDGQLSADIMQESFTRFLERYKKHGSNTPILFTIGRNLLHDHFRSRRKIVEYDENAHREEEKETETLENKEEYLRIMDAIKQLAGDEQELLALVVDGELKYQEIAEITGLSVANVKVKVHRARKKLQILLS